MTATPVWARQRVVSSTIYSASPFCGIRAASGKLNTRAAPAASSPLRSPTDLRPARLNMVNIGFITRKNTKFRLTVTRFFRH